MRVAELNNGVVWKIYNIESNDLPVIPAPGGAVDITGLDPEPEVGDIYNAENSSFASPPEEGEQFQTTGISRTQWRELFTMTEQILSDRVENNIEGTISGLSGNAGIDDEASALGLPAGVKYRDILRTGYKSFSEATELNVTTQKVQLIVQVMAQVGILDAPDRAAVILKGVPLD